MRKDICRKIFTSIILLFYIKYCPQLLGSGSSNLLNYTRADLQYRSIKAVDSNDQVNNGYSFGNTRQDVEDLMRVIANSGEDIRLTRLALEGLQKCKVPEIDEEISKFAKELNNYNEFSFRVFMSVGWFLQMIHIGWNWLIMEAQLLPKLQWNYSAIRSCNLPLTRSYYGRKSKIKKLVIIYNLHALTGYQNFPLKSSYFTWSIRWILDPFVKLHWRCSRK